MTFHAKLEIDVRHHNAVALKPVKNIVLSDANFDQLCEELSKKMNTQGTQPPVAMHLSPLMLRIAGSEVMIYPASYIEIEMFP